MTNPLLSRAMELISDLQAVINRFPSHSDSEAQIRLSLAQCQGYIALTAEQADALRLDVSLAEIQSDASDLPEGFADGLEPGNTATAARSLQAVVREKIILRSADVIADEIIKDAENSASFREEMAVEKVKIDAAKERGELADPQPFDEPESAVDPVADAPRRGRPRKSHQPEADTATNPST